jgi:DNA-binding YbaB/EbfC family protein
MNDDEVVSDEIVDSGPLEGGPAEDSLAELGAPGAGPDLAGMLGGFDLGSVMQMAQDVGARMAEAQERLAATEVEGSAGGGAVKVTLNGHLHLLRVRISPEAVDPSDVAMLEDLVVAAFADAQERVARLQADADPLSGMGGLGGLLGGG